jgi:hypothetical protein
VKLSKAVFLVFIIFLVMITFGFIAYYTFENAFQYALLFVLFFLILTSIMNRWIDHYGDW